MNGLNISLDDLAGGAVAEKINIELQKLAANVLDPNTKATAKRSVTLKIVITPNEKRQIGETDISVVASLAPSQGIPTSFIFDFNSDGTAAMKELMTSDPNQTIINNAGQHADATGQPLGNVVGLTNKFR